MKPFRTLVSSFVVAVLILTAAVVVAYRTIPTRNTNLTHFDTIVVLGTPANPDGTPSPEQRDRTLEGVREFKSGIAPNIILTGGPAHNRFVEAHVMAMLAISQGIPPSAVIEEGRAQNTIQNIFYSQRIMSAHGWTSAEVISSPNHLPRAALILQHYTFAWRTHPAPWNSGYPFWQRAIRTSLEAQYCLKLRLFGFPHSPFLPQPAAS